MFYFKVSKQELMVMEECTGVRTSDFRTLGCRDIKLPFTINAYLLIFTVIGFIGVLYVEAGGVGV